jgi:hypothetical protein
LDDEEDTGEEARDRNHLRKLVVGSFKSIRVHFFPTPLDGLQEKVSRGKS